MVILRCVSVLLVGAWLAGCGHTGGNGIRKNPAIAVGSKDVVFVPVPLVSDSLDTLLGRIGWGEGRFPRELQKEILFQLNRKGVATVEDSAQANSALLVSISVYEQGSGASSRFEGFARLRTGVGERVIDFKKSPARGEAPERQDPIIDNLRMIASSLVDEARKDPNSKKTDPKSDYVPQMMIIF
ncbi:MAG: hypothetical protein ABIW76_07605 [Fibrobacteria bacterium]